MKHYLDMVSISGKVHKRQNRMSVFCIVLAVFLVTAIFGMADMFVRSQIAQAQMDYGRYHIAIRDITDEEAALISRRPEIETAARYGVLNFQGDGSYTFFGKEAVLAGCDREYVTKLLVDIVDEGGFPKNDDEVMVTKNAKDLLGLKIGDSVTINRWNDRDITYRISGFCKNTSKTMSEDFYGFFLTTSAYREIYPARKRENLTDFDSLLLLQFTKTSQMQNTIDRLREECGLSEEQVIENAMLLGLLGQSSDSFMVQIYIVAMVLSVLVLSAGIMMIASSLNSNVAQRTEFFGLMRCVGATPKQVMKLVRREALGWCRFAIPTGIFAGVAVIWILCGILKLSGPEYFGTIPVFSVSTPGILAGAVVGVLTVFLAARSPAKRAAGVSPLAAVLGSASGQNPVRKAADTHFFKVETALGIHHAKSGRKNFILMVLSFSLCVVLFLSFSVVVTFINHALTPLRPWTEDLSIASPDQTCSVDRGLLEKLEKNPVVKASYGRMFSCHVPAVINGANSKADLISYEEKQFSWAGDYLLEGSIKEARRKKNGGLIVYNPLNAVTVGDVVVLEQDGRKVEIKITGILSQCPFYSDAGVETIICSEDTFSNITGQSDYTVIDVQLRRNATDEDVNAIRQMAGRDLLFSDERMENNSTRGVYLCAWLFLYGFLALIVLITISHIVNSIALSVAARTKEYGIFRAIGLDIRQLGKMVVAEAGTYTFFGIAMGTFLGLVFHKILFERMVNFRWGDVWQIPWGELGVIVLVMLLSVVVAVYGPIKRLCGMSVVENIGEQ